MVAATFQQKQDAIICTVRTHVHGLTGPFWRGDSRSIAVRHFQHENEKKNHMEINFIMVVVVIVYNFVMEFHTAK